jgi:hypothetical protein
LTAALCILILSWKFELSLSFLLFAITSQTSP